MIKDLSEDKARELLRRERLARLGCIANGEPYVIPVNYVYDGESALIHSLPGRKIMAMRANPRVCLQVDEVEDDLNWKSATRPRPLAVLTSLCTAIWYKTSMLPGLLRESPHHCDSTRAEIREHKINHSRHVACDVAG